MPIICLRISRRALLGGILLLCLVLAGVAVIGAEKVLSIMTWMDIGPVFRGRSDLPAIALTCNVVWGEEFLPRFLDILQEKEARMTFYLGGKWVENNRDLACRIAAEGHETGNHGYDHRHHQNLDKAGNQVEITKASSAINEIVGKESKLFAPPYGEFNETIVRAADELGYKTVMWSIDTVDWKLPGVSVITGRVLGKAHNGAIVLMHPTAQTVEALPAIIDGLREQGYDLVTVTEILP
ncbi:MAG: polysaccharide deacetylase family protein [bacterium]|jgi:probable sporulation protein (polysaccharide deacetylase family)